MPNVIRDILQQGSNVALLPQPLAEVVNVHMLRNISLHLTPAAMQSHDSCLCNSGKTFKNCHGWKR